MNVNYARLQERAFSELAAKVSKGSESPKESVVIAKRLIESTRSIKSGLATFSSREPEYM